MGSSQEQEVRIKNESGRTSFLQFFLPTLLGGASGNCECARAKGVLLPPPCEDPPRRPLSLRFELSVFLLSFLYS
jgi:hypothetical protein